MKFSLKVVRCGEVAFWNAGQNSEEDVGRGIERSSALPDVAVSARFPHHVHD